MRRAEWIGSWVLAHMVKRAVMEGRKVRCSSVPLSQCQRQASSHSGKDLVVWDLGLLIGAFRWERLPMGISLF